MKAINIFSSIFTLLILPFIVSAQMSVAQDTNASKTEIMDETVYTELGSQLYTTYKMFKAGQLDAATKILNLNGFDQMRLKSYDLKPSGSLDSLVFGSSDQSQIVFVKVDLGYVQNISVSMQLKSENPSLILASFESLMRQDELTPNEEFCIPTICAEFTSKGEYWVVDNRWNEKTFTKFESLYHHLMSAYGDGFVINFSETVPEEWVTRNEVKTYEFAMGK